LAAILFDRPEPSLAAMRLVILLAACGMTLRSTSIPYFATLLLTVAMAAWHRLRWRDLVAVATVTALLIAAWIARSVVLSGYPLYPLPWTPFPVSWAVPPGVLRAHLLETIWHTRGTGTGLPVQQWVSTWLTAVVWVAGKFQVLLPCILGGVAAIAATALGARRLPERLALLLLAPSLGAIAWFATAPEPRFAGAVFWHGGIALVVAALVQVRRAIGAPVAKVAVPAMVAMLLALYLGAGSRARDVTLSWRGAGIAGAPRTSPFETRSGLLVHVPIDDDRCLGAPLPCTPDPDPGLAMRRAPDLSAGFLTSGPLP
jgi:hypothetical protein